MPTSVPLNGPAGGSAEIVRPGIEDNPGGATVDVRIAPLQGAKTDRSRSALELAASNRAPHDECA
ncbi:MAG: hypothetical protein HYR85_04875 [Planctomycetes bacterium]|nr:hypothetical protein [Planctomycetota bacterium]MBI3843472.1 hypothetical protein [Planctomycetota bacterium]